MKKKYNPILDQEPVRDSFILYAAWYKCISSFSAKSQALAFKAICEYALFNIPIPKVGFTQIEYGALITFIPILDSNKRKYENGKKGAIHGSKGGRPKKEEIPVGLMTKTPMGLWDDTPYVSENKKVIVNMNDDVNIIPASPSYDYIYKLLLPVFFFKNCDSKRELKRFYDHYRISEWRLSGGQALNTPKSIVTAAERWKVEDSKPYFPPSFIEVWRKVYEMAPDHLKKDALEISSISRSQTSITIVCSATLYRWLHTGDINNIIIDLFHAKISKSYRLDIHMKKSEDRSHS